MAIITEYSYRNRIIDDIIESEVRYNNMIKSIIYVFKEPAKTMGALYDIRSIQILFGNIDNIYALSCKTLKSFDKVGVIDGFISIFPTLVAFTHYSQNYKNSLCLYTKLINKCPRFSSFVEFQRENQKVSQSLSALLRLPIERLYRYKMLYECLRLNTKNFLQNEKIKKITTKICSVIEIVEEYMFYCDGYTKMCSIQKFLYKKIKINIFLPGRRLINEIVITQNSHITTRVTRVILFNDVLMIFKKYARCYTSKYCWQLTDCEVECKISGNVNCYMSHGTHYCGSPAILIIKHKNKSSSLYFKCMYEASIWKEEISRYKQLLIEQEEQRSFLSSPIY